MERFDYIVVGGGSSGCIVAGKLSDDPSVRVLLLECGDRGEDNPETLRADGYKDAFVNDRVMWERFSTPQPGCGGRRIFMGSGRGMGGGGAVNAMVYTRGDALDYDAWGEGWAWRDVAPEFDALEAELKVNRRPPTDFTDHCVRAAELAGMRFLPDLNAGDLHDVLGYEWMTYDGEERRSAYTAFVRPRQGRANLEVRTGARVRRVVIEGGTATGVVYAQNGHQVHVQADREVVLSAGAIETPKLLMLSGIGPAHHLRRHGLPVLVDATEVGENFQDHPNVQLFFHGRRAVDAQHPQLYGFGRVGGPSPHLETDTHPDTCFVFYPARSSFREGLMRMVPTLLLSPSAYFAKEKLAPRLMAKGIERIFDRLAMQRFIARVWGIVIILGKPKSRGTIRLSSARPDDEALVDPAYFAHPQDLETIRAGVSHARAIAAQRPLHTWGNRELVPGLMNGDAFIRKNVMTTYHYAGSCRMGDDQASVVDRRLRVRGVAGLRVADAAVIPVAPVAALNAPSMLIGWRAAAMIAADHRAKALE
ncbi:MAG: GMC family oxidoreductase N-terminal domain-containing protein [Myxococcota bacterium]